MLAGREAHHALHVLRVRRGEQVIVLNGVGTELTCEVQNYDRDKIQLSVTKEKQIPAPPCPITLLQAVPKGKIIDSIIQKATELGVSRIVPLLSERVATQVDQKGARQKADKWQQVAIEAIKQCGSAWLPLVETPMTPGQFLARGDKFDLPLVASLQPGSRHPRESFREFYKQHGRRPNSACIWIGPEGDFTADEVSAIEAGGTLPVTLGPLVLRVETAATYSLAILNYELQAPGFTT